MRHAIPVISVLLCAIARGDAGIDRVIVESDSGSIHHSMVVCQRPEQNVHCHQVEQQRLNTRVRRQWIAAALNAYHVQLTAAEESDVARHVNREEAEQVAAFFRALDDAVIRIRKGENPKQVYSDAARSGVTAEYLDRELAALPTLDAAEQRAARNTVAAIERGQQDHYREQLFLKRLSEIVERQARERDASFNAAEDQFWSDIIARIHMRIVDPEFTLPSRTGVLPHAQKESSLR